MPKSKALPISPLSPKSPLPPTIQAWGSYLQDQGSSVHTVKAFTGDVRLLASFLPADQAIGSITTNDLNNFLDWMQHKRGVECSPKTLSRRITSLKGFFRWLQSGGVVLADPAERVVQRSVLSPLPAVLSEPQMEQVQALAERQRRGKGGDARAYTLVALLLSTGIKKGETLALKTNHIDLEAAEGPLLFVRYPSPKDRYKERKISLPAEWVEAYQEYRNQYDLSQALFPWSPRRLEYLLEDLGKAAGLEAQLSFLMCRWSCALRDLRSGMEENALRQKLGVSEIQWRELSMKLSRLRAEDQLQLF